MPSLDTFPSLDTRHSCSWVSGCQPPLVCSNWAAPPSHTRHQPPPPPGPRPSPRVQQTLHTSLVLDEYLNIFCKMGLRIMKNHSLDHNLGIKDMILHYNLATRNIIINLSKRERNLQCSLKVQTMYSLRWWNLTPLFLASDNTFHPVSRLSRWSVCLVSALGSRLRLFPASPPPYLTPAAPAPRPSGPAQPESSHCSQTFPFTPNIRHQTW